jgi:hypothetical protein
MSRWTRFIECPLTMLPFIVLGWALAVASSRYLLDLGPDAVAMCGLAGCAVGGIVYLLLLWCAPL